MSVSIHAPVKGATCRRMVTEIGSERFNPRAREGRDRDRVLMTIR